MREKLKSLCNWTRGFYKYSFTLGPEKKLEIVILVHTANTAMETSKAMVFLVESSFGNVIRNHLELAPGVKEGTVQEWLNYLETWSD